MSGPHQIHDVLRSNLFRRKDIDQLAGILEGLGVDISSHLGGDLVGKRHISFLKDSMHPTNADPMCTFKMTHSGILASSHHAYHGLVVIKKTKLGFLPPNCRHNVMAGNPRRVIAKSAATISASGVE